LLRGDEALDFINATTKKDQEDRSFHKKPTTQGAYMKTSVHFLLLFITMILLPVAEGRTADTKAPVPGMVTMVDLGSHACIPCKMMTPILEELEKEYKGKAAIVFIDVFQNEDEAKRFAVSLIPTQIFFDRSGKEVYRHSGFLEKQAIIDRLETMLEKK
jgi:thioredoxin